MSLDFDTLEKMRQSNAAWRLLCADQAPLIISFLHRVFIKSNERVMAEADLAEALEDELFTLRERLGAKRFPKSALEYLNDWAANEKGWLRKFYQIGSDEPFFDITPATERAISWLASLTARSFIGTESRLLLIFELLKQLSDGNQVDASIRIAELEKRQADIAVEIARIKDGDIRMMTDTAIKDRFQQFAGLARELLTDFREVEQNFRGLDRQTREQIALWQGSKGELLERIMGERDAISDSDQGRSFQAFWDFLMSQRRQEELTTMLDDVLKLAPVVEMAPDPRLRRVHYDWLDAGEHTQRTVAQLSQQLRRFLDDKAWLENRRIMDVLRSIEARAIAVKQVQPRGDFTSVEAESAQIELSMERRLYTPAFKPKISSSVPEADEADIDPSILFSQIVIDKPAIARHIRQSLQTNSRITLCELIKKRPLEHGLAEIVVYLQLAGDTFDTVTDEEQIDSLVWTDGKGLSRKAQLKRLIFVR